MATVKSAIEKTIIDKLTELLSFFNLTATIDSEMENGILRLSVQTNNDELFIGRTADPLLALQHLLRVMFKQELTQGEASLILNIGDFQNQQRATLEAIANRAIEEVHANSQPSYLRPMSSYERRIVHMVLADHPEVTSESEGEGPSRRIVVRLK